MSLRNEGPCVGYERLKQPRRVVNKAMRLPRR